MAVRIQTADMTEFELVLLIDQPQSWQQAAAPREYVTRAHKQAGQISLSAIPMPGIFVAAMHWRTADAVILEGGTGSENININFQTKGHLHTHFKGLRHDLDMQAGRHNLVYTPEKGEWHQIKANDNLEMLHVSIDRDHFRNLIGTEGAWCNRVLRELEAERPFSGTHGTGCITGAMQQLIQGIRQQSPSAPMCNLLQQSRLLELLALQLAQFTAIEGESAAEWISRDDQDKLYWLKTYLDTCFLEELSLTQLARLSLLNEFKLKRGFRQLFGTTVFGYLRDLRMNHATRLLRDHKLQVEEVAGMLGYEHAHHFSAAFKKHFGSRPSEWMGRNHAR
ncbi:MAG: helix-turn-helix transcriptional regulator [Williamsia sp.]|nr:helix-turn-helix transcriptional regulator [Williamsia sp.]